MNEDPNDIIFRHMNISEITNQAHENIVTIPLRDHSYEEVMALVMAHQTFLYEMTMMHFQRSTPAPTKVETPYW